MYPLESHISFITSVVPKISLLPFEFTYFKVISHQEPRRPSSMPLPILPVCKIILPMVLLQVPQVTQCCWSSEGDILCSTHTQIQPTQAHACIHTCLAWGHKCKQGTQVFQELKTALSSNVGDGVNRHHVLPLGLPVHLLPKLLRIFPRKPEATSSAACVVVVVTSEW